MQKDRLKYLLENYAQNRLSDQELTELENWYHELNYGEQGLDQWIEEVGGEDVLANLLYENFEQKNLEKPKIKSFSIINRVAVAASILLMLSVGLYFYQSNSALSKKSGLAAPEIAAIKPGSNRAVLTLSNGKQINLETAANGQLTEDGGILVNKSAEGHVSYEPTGKHAATEINTISTPNGGQYQITLTDGTRVWLNAASSLKYPTKFSGGERKVELTGEAYFEVTHNEKSPFLVTSNNQVVKVLGTHFNIKAYANEPITKTTLIAGSVSVNAQHFNASKILSPGKQAILSETGLSVQDADIKEAMAWKNGYFMFKDEDIYVIMNQVSRWYDVEVIYTSKFENKRFGGLISRSKKITDLLDIMESTKGIRFKIEGRRVTVMK